MEQNLLLAENITKSYGEKLLFEDLTLGVAAGQKMALIARNGTGKTSLLNILTGRETPEKGKVSSRRDTRITYLEQNPQLPPSLSILDAIFESTNEFTQAVREYEQASDRLRKENTPANQDKLNQTIALMDRLEAWDYEARVREVLGRFAITDLGMQCGHLSGGQRKKVALAKALIEPADILILDEPTNHLDISMIEWLESHLSREKLSILIVTHDRYFLDSVCNEILELEDGKLHRYKGNYAYYLEKKEERQQVENAELSKTRQLMRSELEWIRRSPSARTTKSKARKEAFYGLQEKASGPSHEKQASFQVKNQRMGGKILEIHNIHKSYGDKKLIDDFTYIFKKREKVGITGANGTGKSTLLNLIAGNLRPDLGTITVGQTVEFGYYTQDGLKPEGNKRILELVKEIAEEVELSKGSMSASQFLMHFGFDKNLQHSYFENLSGGEKRKLYLLMTLMASPNFLILDEPTNDLDIHTLNLLEDFLMNFDGCLLIVSHDRYFMDKLVDHIFVFEGEGRIKDFYGNYTEYYLDRSTRERRLKQAKAEITKKPERKKERDPLKPTYKQIKEFEGLEAEIAALEEEKEKLLKKLNVTDADPEELSKWSSRIGEIMDTVNIKELRWLELSELIETYENQKS